MNNEADLAAIDAHTERIRGYDHALSRVYKPFLNRFPIGSGKTGVICGGFHTRPTQAAIDVFHILSRSGVHDTKRRPSSQLHNSPNLFRVRRDLAHFEIEIWAIESANDLKRAIDTELRDNVAADRRRRSCCQG